MSDDLRARMRAVFAGNLINSGKGALPRYSVDSAKETSRYTGPSVTRELASQIKTVTRVRAFSTNINSPGKYTCAVCSAGGDLWHLDTPTGPVAVHKQCAELLPKPDPAEPTAAYRAASAEPDGNGCRVEIVELPQAQRYRRTFAHLQLRPPAHIPEDRWQQAIADGRAFLHQWGETAQRLGWTSVDLFGLHTPPEQPHPFYNRLSRYDATGLCWLLQGKKVIALTTNTATIRHLATGNITTYRRHNKPALGPLGDSLDDLQ